MDKGSLQFKFGCNWPIGSRENPIFATEILGVNILLINLCAPVELEPEVIEEAIVELLDENANKESDESDEDDSSEEDEDSSEEKGLHSW